MINSKGQATIEYVLLTGVILVILVSFLPLVRERLIGNGNCLGADQQKLFCVIIRSTQLNGGNSGTYRYYSLSR